VRRRGAEEGLDLAQRGPNLIGWTEDKDVCEELLVCGMDSSIFFFHFFFSKQNRTRLEKRYCYIRNLLHMIDITKACPGCGRKALGRFGFHLFHCAKTFSPPLRNGLHVIFKEKVVCALDRMAARLLRSREMVALGVLCSLFFILNRCGLTPHCCNYIVEYYESRVSGLSRYSLSPSFFLFPSLPPSRSLVVGRQSSCGSVESLCHRSQY
jgi:hypothetical protein